MPTYLVDKTTTTRQQFRLEADNPNDAKAKVKEGKGDNINSHDHEAYSVRVQGGSPLAERVREFTSKLTEPKGKKEDG